MTRVTATSLSDLQAQLSSQPELCHERNLTVCLEGHIYLVNMPEVDAVPVTQTQLQAMRFRAGLRASMGWRAGTEQGAAEIRQLLICIAMGVVPPAVLPSSTMDPAVALMRPGMRRAISLPEGVADLLPPPIPPRGPSRPVPVPTNPAVGAQVPPPPSGPFTRRGGIRHHHGHHHQPHHPHGHHQSVEDIIHPAVPTQPPIPRQGPKIGGLTQRFIRLRSDGDTPPKVGHPQSAPPPPPKLGHPQFADQTPPPKPLGIGHPQSGRPQPQPPKVGHPQSGLPQPQPPKVGHPQFADQTPPPKPPRLSSLGHPQIPPPSGIGHPQFDIPGTPLHPAQTKRPQPHPAPPFGMGALVPPPPPPSRSEEQIHIDISALLGPRLEPPARHYPTFADLKVATRPVLFIPTPDGRFKDIQSPEATNVELRTNHVAIKGRIHANHIWHPKSTCRPIATQYPSPGKTALPMVQARENFWRMILQQKCDLILDLTKPEEQGKLGPIYYPHFPGEVMDYGRVIITRMDEGTGETCRYKVQDIRSKEVREILRHQFTQWPDHGEVSEQELHKLAGMINRCGHPVIHCRAGVGRTGTALAASILREHHEHGRLTPTNAVQMLTETVLNLRQNRGPATVQTNGQWQLLQRYVDWLLQSQSR